MIEVRTPCRLHFGLFAYGGDPGKSRQFGGVGLMIRKPDILIRLEPVEGEDFVGTGLMSDRAVEFARRFAARAVERGLTDRVEPATIRVLRVPRPHTGLGTGTQLGMAVGHALAARLDRADLAADQLAALVGRGERSAIGAHGFFHGGLIVEGGKFDLTTLSPMLVRQPVPEHWRIVLIRPRQLQGLSGQREREAFARLPVIPEARTAQMCRLVLLGLVPAAVDGDLATFGEALFELQQVVGQCFAVAQGGTYAHPLLQEIVDHVRAAGVAGIGQSSWGPTLYAITGDDDTAVRLAANVQARFDLTPGEVLVTSPDNHGASLKRAGSASERR